MILIESLHHINLAAKDLKTSREFYESFMDFEVINETADTALLNFEDINILLTKVDSFEPSKTPLLSFIMDIDDFTDALQDIEANNVTIVAGPSETPRGENLVIRDPAGNLIELFYED